MKAKRGSLNLISRSSRFIRPGGSVHRSGRGDVSDSLRFQSSSAAARCGRGYGSFLVAVLRRCPALRGTLFELPQAAAVARQRLAKEPELTRIEIVEGDIFNASLPSDYDVVLVANAVHTFSVVHNLELMRNIRAAAQADTRLLLVDLWTDSTGREPAAAALMSGAFLLTSGEGQTHSEREADMWLEQTGWRKLERTVLAGPTSPIVAEAI